MLTSLFKKRLKIMPSTAETIWEKTVAIAAPLMPMAGKPNLPKIRIGSSTMLVTAPTADMVMHIPAWPTASSMPPME